jgi:outer membrane protein assembly factor BamB
VRRLAALSAALFAVATLPGGALALRGGGGAARNGDHGLAWAAYGGDAQLTNQAPATTLDAAAAGSLGLVWDMQLDGPVVASPLALDGRLFVATEAGSVYGLNAVTGTIEWRTPLGSQLSASGCGTYGISSTGAIDVTRGLLYVANADGLVHALELTSGAETAGWPVRLIDRPEVEYVWGGLRIAADRLYVPVASFCDAPDGDGRPADGRVVALDLATRAPAVTFDTVAGPDNLGGVWGWGGVSVEPDGSALYTAIGNSHVLDPGCGCFVDNAGLGDSVVRLTPDLVPVSSSRPADVPAVNDYDFGAAPLLFQPAGCPPLAAANNKDGFLYVWDRDDLAKGPIFETAVGNPPQPFVGAPSWSARLGLLFDAGAKVLLPEQSPSGGVSAFRVGAGCVFQPSWRTAFGRGTEPPPLVLGDALFAVGGFGGGYAVLDARTGRRLWSFATDGKTLAPPIVVGNLVVTADDDGVVRVFGPPSLGAS